MNCKKCGAEIPKDAVFCHKCGVRQQPQTQRPKSRGNGQGSAYKTPNGKWAAVVTLGYTLDDDGKKHRITRSKYGFGTKKDAVAYLPQLRLQPKTVKLITFKEIYEKWYPTHRADASTMGCYRAAYKYFRDVWYYRMADIGIDDLQECLDDCPRGRRTLENMKALAGLMYKYAVPRRQASLNLGQYLIVSGERGSKDGLPMDVLKKIQGAVGTVPYADFVVSECYLGFRPGELLDITVDDYDPSKKAFVGGSKTDAGRDRVVTVSPKIQPIIDVLVSQRHSGHIFSPDGKKMSPKAYREAFYAVLDAVGFDNPIKIVNGQEYHTYTPHSCRHTFATLMKSVQAPDKDKLELIGHTSTEMLRHYQDVDLEALRRVTDAL